MGWVLIAAAAWLLLGLGLALLIGRSIRLVDRRAAEDETDAANFVVDRPVLVSAPEPPRPPVSETPAGQGREAPTIPGLPASRPPVGRPAVPRSTRQRRNTSGHG